MSSTPQKSLSWDVVEKTIIKEQKWLSDNLLRPFYKEGEDFYKSEFCENCILRQMTIIKSKICLWGDEKTSKNIIKPHGKEKFVCRNRISFIV